jgi:precorrin-6A/cobalt-precorrin-6A reductase
MLLLVQDRGIRAIVDATHPYAVTVRAAAIWTAERANVPYMTFVRPNVEPANENTVIAKDHEEAAVLAFAERKPVLLTTGSRNLEPYLRESSRTGIQLVARVLDHADSVDACRRAGLQDDQVVVGRGPFSVSENRATIRMYGIGMLVTKDSGRVGGVHEKLQAAHEERCKVVIVQRPLLSSHCAFECVKSLIAEVICKVSPRFG